MDENLNDMNSGSDEAKAADNNADGKKKAKKKKTPLREVLEWVEAIVIAIVVAFFIKQFIMTVVMVDGDSMKNTLHHQERLIVWELGYQPKNNDIIIFEPPAENSVNSKHFFMQNKTYYVKRVIATEGQTVKIDYDENKVYVDGKLLNENYIKSDEDDVMEQRGYNAVEEYTVPEGEVFVMGDNRNNSLDSRAIGSISKKSILGKVLVRFWPLNKIGTVK